MGVDSVPREFSGKSGPLPLDINKITQYALSAHERAKVIKTLLGRKLCGKLCLALVNGSLTEALTTRQ